MFGIDKIPESTGKISLAISILGFYLLYINYEKRSQQTEHFLIEYTQLGDSIMNITESVSYEKNRLFDRSKYLSSRYNVDSLIIAKDTSYVLNLEQKPSKDYLAAIQEILPDYNNYMARVHTYQSLVKRFQLLSATNRIRSEFSDKRTWVEFSMIGVNLLLFLISLSMLRKIEKRQETRDLYLEKEKGEIRNYCESCGRKFDTYINYGRNSDGSVNFAFCRECLISGEFVLSYEQVKGLVLSDESINDDQKDTYITYLNSLDRWRKNRYPTFKQ